MSGRHSQQKLRRSTSTSLPIDETTWQAVVKELRLCRQQAHIVELILRSMKDKEIAAEMGLGVPTVRTYLGRIFVRLGVRDRMELVLRIFARAQHIATHDERHHS